LQRRVTQPLRISGDDLCDRNRTGNGRGRPFVVAICCFSLQTQVRAAGRLQVLQLVRILHFFALKDGLLRGRRGRMGGEWTSKVVENGWFFLV
jgi:hypothetical protein